MQCRCVGHHNFTAAHSVKIYKKEEEQHSYIHLLLLDSGVYLNKSGVFFEKAVRTRREKCSV